MKFISSSIFTIFFTYSAYAQTSPQPKMCETVTVEDINVMNHKKTGLNRIIKFLDIPLNTPIKLQKVKNSAQRLRNTDLFTSLKAKVIVQKECLVKLEIDVKDKWTTIPIVKFKSGGGSKHLTLGAFDPNIFGSLQEVGAQYEWLDGKHSGVAWYKNPNFINSRNRIGIELWKTNKIREIYTQKIDELEQINNIIQSNDCLLYTSPSPRDATLSRMPSSA